MEKMNIKVGKTGKLKTVVIGFLWVLLLLVLISVAIYGLYLGKYTKPRKTENIKIEELKPVDVKKKQLQIFKGNDRPIAVMIDNETGAWPQTSLQDAYMVYEIIIEGGQTRMMAMFKDKSPDKIGPIRSSRHYFVEYAMEHGAIYTHFGWSPKAQAIIEQYRVNNVNGMYYGDKDKLFWREGKGYHTAFTNIKNIKEISKTLKYNSTNSDKSIYKYNEEEYNLKEAKAVTGIKLTYSFSHNTSYIYDSEKKVFMRSMRGIKHIDRVTKEQFFAKNIVVITANNYTKSMVGDRGRQELENKGTGKGHYLTNGKVIDITWKKESDSSKTYLYDLTGSEIILNDGITFFQIVPTTKNSVNITYKPV